LSPGSHFQALAAGRTGSFGGAVRDGFGDRLLLITPGVSPGGHDELNRN
jgi:hypothetical protein